nr:hypothetical protein [uncultured Duganella sp.]
MTDLTVGIHSRSTLARSARYSAVNCGSVKPPDCRAPPCAAAAVSGPFITGTCPTDLSRFCFGVSAASSPAAIVNKISRA